MGNPQEISLYDNKERSSETLREGTTNHIRDDK